MRFPFNERPGWTMEIDTEVHELTIRNEKDEVVLNIPVDEAIQFLLARKSDGYGLRREPRVNAAVQLKYADEEGKEYEGLAGTISGGGLFLESHSLYPVGTSLRLEIKLPHHPDFPVCAAGEVVWTRPKMERAVLFPGMGIKFSQISDEDKERVIEFVKIITRRPPSG
jgi:type IV pilus assembly protein PilZ